MFLPSNCCCFDFVQMRLSSSLLLCSVWAAVCVCGACTVDPCMLSACIIEAPRSLTTSAHYHAHLITQRRTVHVQDATSHDSSAASTTAPAPPSHSSNPSSTTRLEGTSSQTQASAVMLTPSASGGNEGTAKWRIFTDLGRDCARKVQQHFQLS